MQSSNMFKSSCRSQSTGALRFQSVGFVVRWEYRIHLHISAFATYVFQAAVNLKPLTRCRPIATAVWRRAPRPTEERRGAERGSRVWTSGPLFWITRHPMKKWQPRITVGCWIWIYMNHLSNIEDIVSIIVNELWIYGEYMENTWWIYCAKKIRRTSKPSIPRDSCIVVSMLSWGNSCTFNDIGGTTRYGPTFPQVFVFFWVLSVDSIFGFQNETECTWNRSRMYTSKKLSVKVWFVLVSSLHPRTQVETLCGTLE